MTAYALAFGSLLLIGGRVADLIGRRAAILIGLAGFGLASALGGASVDLRMLIVARVLQGVSGALLAPALLAVITTAFTDERERGKAFGILGSVAIQEECSGMVQFLTTLTDQECGVELILACSIGVLAAQRTLTGGPPDRVTTRVGS